MRAPTKKQSHIILAALLLLTTVTYYLTRSNQPIYEGKTLTQWLEKLDTDLANFRTADIDSPQLADSVGAIRVIGTNGIPTLLQFLVKERTPRVNSVERFVRKLGWKHFRIPVDDKPQLAIWGFWALGKDARPATQQLIEIVNTGTGDSRGNALSCLTYFESDKELMLPVLLHLLNDPDKSMTRYATNRLLNFYPEEAKNAGVYKKMPSTKISTTNSPAANK